MNTANLKILLSQYDQKRNEAIARADEKKVKLYAKLPELERIDNDISAFSIKTIRAILAKPNKEYIDELNSKISNLKKERLALLKKNNISLKDLEPVFECKKCNDTGYVKTPTGSDLCSCIKQKLYNIEYNNSNIYDLQNQNFNNFKLDFYSDDIDKSRYNRDISPRKNILSIKNMCDKFITNFDDPKEPNLLFSGSPGLGKTFLSSCIANEIIKKGKTVLYQTAPIMLDSIIDYKFGKSSNNILSTISSVDLLIIDDLGTETRNSMKVTELFNIINSRLLNQDNRITKTIISTNLSLQDLYNTYEERIVSRIIGNYNACYFYGDDIRIKKKIALK